MEQLILLIRKRAPRGVFYTGFEEFYGIAHQYQKLGEFSENEDNLIERARVLIAAMELSIVKRCCRRLIRTKSKWEQEARGLLIRSLLFQGKFRRVEKELRIMDERFPEETEAKVDYALASLAAGRKRGLRYAQKLVDEDSRTFVNVGVQVSRFLMSRDRFEDALKLLNSLRYRVGHDDRSLNWAIARLESDLANILDFKKFKMRRFLVWNMLKQVALFLLVGAFMYRIASTAFMAAPALIEKSAQLIDLEFSGVKSENVIVNAHMEDVAFGLKRIRYSFQNQTTENFDIGSWQKGESLVFTSEAEQIINESELQVVTFSPLENEMTVIGALSYKRVIALWFASWEKLQGAAILLAIWLSICGYYLVNRVGLKYAKA